MSPESDVYQGEPFYDDDGQLVGFVLPSGDGGHVLHDGEGTIVAAVAVDGTPLDPSEYVIDDGSSYEPEPGHEPNQWDEMAQRIAYLEAQAAAQEQQPVHEPVHEPVQQEPSQEDIDTTVDIMENNFELLEREYGRALTNDEVNGVLAQLDRQVSAAHEANFEDAARAAGLKPFADMSRDDRDQWVVARASDAEGPDAPVDDTPQSFDLHTGEGRDGFVLARMEGRPIADATADAETPGDAEAA